jgi:hypothetical protein
MENSHRQADMEILGWRWSVGSGTDRECTHHTELVNLIFFFNVNSRKSGVNLT